MRQIARYLPHHRSENASKTHPKSSHDKFKTASKNIPLCLRASVFDYQLFLHVFASLRSIISQISFPRSPA